MILVDTSIWIDHFNKGGAEPLYALFASESVITHPFILGEIAMGSLRDRSANLALLGDFPQIPVAAQREVSTLIESTPLYNSGLSYIDAHLLAAVLAAGPDQELRLWTRDKRLHAQAEHLGIAYAPAAR
jgi:predicted nucleic acid-binding protein